MTPETDRRRNLLTCAPACLVLLLLNILPAVTVFLAEASLTDNWSLVIARWVALFAVVAFTVAIEATLALFLALLILRRVEPETSSKIVPAWLVAVLPLCFFWRILFGGSLGFVGNALTPVTFAWEIWRTLPLSVLLLYTHLHRQGAAIRQAVLLDTSSRSQRFFRFYVPMAKPAILLLLALRIFDLFHSSGIAIRVADSFLVSVPLLAALLALAAAATTTTRQLGTNHAAATRLGTMTLTALALAVLVRFASASGVDTLTSALACGVIALLSTALATPLATAIGRPPFSSRTLILALVVLASATPPRLLAQLESLPHVSIGLAIGVPIAFWTVFLSARSLPRDIEDACRIDGVPPGKILTPALRPAVTAGAALVFLYCWFDLAI